MDDVKKHIYYIVSILHLGIIRNFIMLEIAGKILLIIDKISNKNPAIHIFQKVSKKFQSQIYNYFLVMRAFASHPDFCLFFPKSILGFQFWTFFLSIFKNPKKLLKIRFFPENSWKLLVFIDKYC